MLNDSIWRKLRLEWAEGCNRSSKLHYWAGVCGDLVYKEWQDGGAVNIVNRCQRRLMAEFRSGCPKLENKRLGTPLCQPHICVHCNREVSSLGLHGLSCLKSQGRHPRHFELNQIIHRSLHSARIPSRLEPSGLSSSDRSRPDGLSLTPWSSGKFLVWDATCTDTYCASNIARTSSEPGLAAAHAESQKTKTYSYLCFVPVGVETSDVFGPQAASFFKDLGRRLRNVSGDPLSHTYLIQRISVAIQ